MKIFKKRKHKKNIAKKTNYRVSFKSKHNKALGAFVVFVFVIFLIGTLSEEQAENNTAESKISFENITLEKNDSFQLNFGDESETNLTFNDFNCFSSDNQIAQVINNKVFGLSEGEVDISCEMTNIEFEPFSVIVTVPSKNQNEITIEEPSTNTETENQTSNDNDNSSNKESSSEQPTISNPQEPSDVPSITPPNETSTDNNGGESTIIEDEENNKDTVDNPQKEPTQNRLLIVSFIDVGQGDSILIQTPNNKNILIDAGTSGSSTKIVNYLISRGVSKIDALIGTHPHADHIGGMANVINSFAIGSIYMPNVSSTTQTFENLLLTIQNKGMTIKTAKSGVTIDIDPLVKAQFIAPISTRYSDINQYSAVLKVTYNSTSFLFTGDAGQISENEMINSGVNLKADVLKVGHHGSSTSTTQAFLNTVSPSYAVIAVGSNNRYGHPHDIVLERLRSMNVTTFRTDLNGTIVISSDGLKVNVE